ncbi:MAG: cobalamin adenosyltransferase, partial [Rhodocyclaceae bacterium]|nr:cobalamin adenosyltransferase [Rhodocyclaceae bacterium]
MDVAARQSTVGWEAASAAVSAAVAHAASVGACVNAAVVDRAGQLVSFLRMPGAPLHSVDIAIDKAYTAASFGLPTGDWAAALSSHSDAVRQGLPLRP